MEQLQSSGILELVHYVTQQSVSTLTETVQSSGNEPSEFQKELEYQTKAAQSETAEVEQQPKPETKAEQSEKAPVEECENAKQTLETEQIVMQQLIAAGVVNITPVNENAIPQEAGIELAAEPVAAVNPMAASEEMKVLTEGTAQQSAAEQMPALNVEQSGQPVETAGQEQATVQETVSQAELSPQQGESNQNPQFSTTRENASQSTEREEIQVTDAAEAQQPLFKEVNEIPVKVGETEAPKQTAQAASVEEQVETKLTEALQQGESRVEIRLNPEYLGTIKVELTRSTDGTLSIVLSTENSQTGSLLEKHSANLQNLLMANGQERVQVEVHTAQENQQHPQQDLADGHNGNQRQGQQQSRREEQNAQDFLQQLRLGLIPTEEAS